MNALFYGWLGQQLNIEPQVAEQLVTVRDYTRWAATQFSNAGCYFGHGTDNAWDEAVFLVLGALHLPWDVDPQALDARLTTLERQRIVALVEKRAVQRVPVAYLINQAWFAGLPFYVDERVLVPRSPIAELISNGFTPWAVGEEVNQILDLCTGSGCIGIACALAFPNAAVDLVDLSAEALEVASKNIERHDCAERVRALESDLFTNLHGQKYDLIVTNPPYVDGDDYATMPAEYRHEPALGLAAGSDGLEVVDRILAQAGSYLTEYGVLVGEVGNSQEALIAAYPELPFIWVELEEGGHGVFVLTAAQLQQHQQRQNQGSAG